MFNFIAYRRVVFEKIMEYPLVFKYLIIIFLSAFLSSCYAVRNIEIEVAKPAEIRIPNELSKLTVVNATMLKNNPKTTFKNQEPYHYFDSTLSARLVKDVSGFLAQSPRFKEVNEHSKPYLKNIENFTNPLSWEHTEQICYANKTQALLALEAIKVKDTILRFSYFEDLNYHSEKSLVLFVNSFWRLYDFEKKEIYLQKNYIDTIYISDFYSFKNMILVAKNQDKNNSIVNDLSYKISLSITAKIAPYWLQETRQLIDVENKTMKIALRYAKKENWKKAAEIWQQFTTSSSDKKIVAAACFNLAVASEVMGKIDLSLVWLKKSKENYEFYTTEDYQQKIKQRIKEIKKLDEQLKKE